MAQITKINNAPKGDVSYNKTALDEMMTKFSISRRDMMAVFGQTNPSTINLWRAGGDLSIGAMAGICNAFDLNPLNFIMYAGKPIQSSIIDLYRLELCGLTVADILSYMGIDTYVEEQYEHTFKCTEELATESAARRDVDKKVIEQFEMYKLKSKNAQETQIPTSVIIDKITEIQNKAFVHEQEALEELRRKKDADIAARDQTIMKLKLTLARMGYQGYISENNAMAADDSQIGGSED